jgi:hypothetical protein
MATKIKLIKSFTDPDVEYRVTIRDGSYRCNCPDCVIRNRDCKHIRNLKGKKKE